MADGSIAERSGMAECVLLPAEEAVSEVPEQVPVTEGAFAELDCRLGEVTHVDYSDEDRHEVQVILRWLDDGSQSEWIKKDKQLIIEKK